MLTIKRDIAAFWSWISSFILMECSDASESGCSCELWPMSYKADVPLWSTICQMCNLPVYYKRWGIIFCFSLLLLIHHLLVMIYFTYYRRCLIREFQALLHTGLMRVLLSCHQLRLYAQIPKSFFGWPSLFMLTLCLFCFLLGYVALFSTIKHDCSCWESDVTEWERQTGKRWCSILSEFSCIEIFIMFMM